MDSTIESRSGKHLYQINHGKQDEKLSYRTQTIEKDNLNLFNKIEEIMYRPRPFKKQDRKKVFHVPGDHTIGQHTIIPQPSYSIGKVKK